MRSLELKHPTNNGYTYALPENDELRERVLENLAKAKEFPNITNYSRNKHYIGVRTAATAATLRVAACNLWNPSAASRIQLWEVWLANTVATAYNVSLARSTARGTASTTATTAVANSVANDAAAPSGAVVDSAWSVAPTIGAADLIRWNIPATIGAGVIFPFPDPIDIPPTGGMALIAATATIFQPSDVTFVIGD